MNIFWLAFEKNQSIKSRILNSVNFPCFGDVIWTSKQWAERLLCARHKCCLVVGEQVLKRDSLLEMPYLALASCVTWTTYITSLCFCLLLRVGSKQACCEDEMNRKQGAPSLPSCVAWTASAILTSSDVQSLHSVEESLPPRCSFLMSAVGLIKLNK